MDSFELFEVLLYLIVFAFGIFLLVLPFKIWGLCKDVRRLRIHFLKGEANEFLCLHPVGTKVHVDGKGREASVCGIDGDRIKVKFPDEKVACVWPSDLTPVN